MLCFLGLSTSGQDETAHEILKKLDEPSSKQNVKSVSGGVLIDMENSDNYGMKAKNNSFFIDFSILKVLYVYIV